MTDIEKLLVPPWSELPLVHEETKLFPAPTMDALRTTFVPSVTIVANPSDTPAQNLAKLQAGLNAAAGFANTLVTVGRFDIPEDSTLVVKSGTYWDHRRGHVYCPDNSFPIVRNEHAVLAVGTPTTGNGPNRDSDIYIDGGIFESGAGSGAGHRLFFHQVDRVGVSGLTLITRQGKYSVLFADCTAFYARSIDLDVYSDGIHVTGPASQGHIADITGKSEHDDIVGTTVADYATYDYSRGSITDMTVERISASAPARAVLVGGMGNADATGTFYVTNWTIRDISADVSYGIRIGVNAVAAGATVIVDEINIQGEQNHAVGNGTAYVSILGGLNGSRVGTVRVGGMLLPEAPRLSSGRRVGISIDGPPIKRLIVGGTFADTADRDTRAIELLNASVVETLEFDGRAKFVNTSSRVLLVEGTSRVKHAEIRGEFDGGLIVRDDNTAQIDYLVLTGRHVTTTVSVLHRTANLMRVHLNGFEVVSSGSAIVQMQNVSTASVEITGSGRTSHANGVVQRSTGTQVATVKSPSLSGEVDRMTPTAGSIVYNTKGSLACGVGLVAADGTKWKNLMTAAEYTPA